MIELPTDLCAYGILSLRCGKAGGFRGVSGGTECVGTHVSGGRGLPGRSCDRHRRRRELLAGWDSAYEAAAYLTGDVSFAVGELPCSGDQGVRASIPWCFLFEDFQHVFCAVRRPRRDGPPVRFGEGLWGAHTPCLPNPGAPLPADVSPWKSHSSRTET